ncbi:nucleotidyl transferase AbiEii/AbiGii toxin family protein [Listeria innocua]|nr:nucleotidyl transferase AbiEii/AbiGii toxin family protein [Listeria innocua]
MSFKAKIRQLATEKGLTTQQVQQSYLLERFLVRLSKSQYQANFIVKGGYLIGRMVGLNSRATMDLDTTIKGFELTAENLAIIIEEILQMQVADSFTFEFIGVAEIREHDDYTGYRVKLLARYEKIQEPLTIDVTTGDVIIPKELEVHFPQLFDEGEISLLAYPLETVLAEKLETIVSRGTANTRPRDFYDVYILQKMKAEYINLGVLKEALAGTMTKRKTHHLLAEFPLILSEIQSSEVQQSQWQKYQQQYVYASDVAFQTVVESVITLLNQLKSS